MLPTTNYMNELFAQRKQFISSFQAFKINVEQNSLRLHACSLSLEQTRHSFFSCADIELATQVLAQKKELSYSCCLLMLQLYNKLHHCSQSLLTMLYQSDDKLLQSVAPLMSLLTDVDDNVLNINTDEVILNQQLLGCLYRRNRDSIQAFYSRYFEQCSPLTQLYLKVLHHQTLLNASLISDFIYLEQLTTTLFELYIVKLSLTDLQESIVLINDSNLLIQLDKDQLIIKIVALSGYADFIPLIARYLQKKDNAFNAHFALRQLLGARLNDLIPERIQFNSDEVQRLSDLPYYGAKILHYWDISLQCALPKRLLDGQTINDNNLKYIEQHSSQVHRRIANLHRVQSNIAEPVNYYALPSVVL